jgi:hypothetical protein
MSNIKYEIPREKIDTGEILDLVFKDSSVKHGLHEFSKNILKRISAFEKPDGRFYIRCLKRGKHIFVYDMNKKTGKPEEVIRQFRLSKIEKNI